MAGQGKGIQNVIPLYFRIFLTLEQKIRAGHWPVGVVLPSEQELAAEFGVSRVTIRNTMALLEAADMITRHRGRGTFVNPDLQFGPGDDNIAGLKKNTLEFQETTEVELHEFAEVDVPAEAKEQAAHPLADRALRIRRSRRRPGQKPFSHSVAYVLPPESLTLSAGTLGNRTVLAALEEQGFDFARAEQRVTAMAAPDDIAAYLQVAPGSPVTSLRRWVFDAHDRLVEFLQIHYDPDMYEYRMGLSKDTQLSSPPEWVPRT
ncbi:GntR family transcriptional regulator [Chachezhania sediminis]|uniref:GntR family transcriptional regulator n=1 Tax=Chachezhania sediminis TaxID=2599291 RepID=UPI00131D1B77|nr:GntR family transcriptional regulator [Chachezhania sediminis]